MFYSTTVFSESLFKMIIHFFLDHHVLGASGFWRVEAGDWKKVASNITLKEKHVKFGMMSKQPESNVQFESPCRRRTWPHKLIHYKIVNSNQNLTFFNVKINLFLSFSFSCNIGIWGTSVLKIQVTNLLEFFLFYFSRHFPFFQQV